MENYYDDPVRFRETPTYTYLIACDGYAKIGITERPKSRLSQIQTGNPYQCTIVWAKQFPTKRIAEEYESYLHDKFIDLNVRGEWFLFQGELYDYYIEELLDEMV